MRSRRRPRPSAKANPPKRPLPLYRRRPSQPRRPSPDAPDGGRGASATANKTTGLTGRENARTARPNRAVFACRILIRRAYVKMQSADNAWPCPLWGAHPKAKSATLGLSYGALRKECLEALRQWPGCEDIGCIQIMRDTPGGFRSGHAVRQSRQEDRRSRHQWHGAREAAAFPSQ